MFLGCRAELGPCQPSSMAPWAGAVRGQLESRRTGTAEVLGIGFLLAFPEPGQKPLSARLDVSRGTGEIKRFSDLGAPDWGLVPEPFGPCCVAQLCVTGPMSQHLVQPRAALDSSEILGPSCPVPDASHLAASTSDNPLPSPGAGPPPAGTRLSWP